MHEGRATAVIFFQSTDISLFKIFFFHSRIYNTIIIKICKRGCLDYIMRAYYGDGENCMMKGFSIQSKAQAHAEHIIKTGTDKSAQSPGFYTKARENDVSRYL